VQKHVPTLFFAPNKCKKTHYILFCPHFFVSLERERWNQVEPRCAALGFAALLAKNGGMAAAIITGSENE
jgi:hypothetical protein